MSAQCPHCGLPLTPNTTIAEGESVTTEVPACSSCERVLGVAGTTRRTDDRLDVDAIIDLFDAAMNAEHESQSRAWRYEALGALESQFRARGGVDMVFVDRLFTGLMGRHRWRRSQRLLGDRDGDIGPPA
jgi:hypothetical protein